MNYKRKKPRTVSRKTHDKWKDKKDPLFNFRWLGRWPRWWDVVFHRRPHRRRATALLKAIYRGADPEGMVWPVNKKPHNYYW